MKDKYTTYFDEREVLERGLYDESLYIDNISKELHRISKAFDITGNTIMAETLYNIFSDLKASAENIRGINNKKSRLENDKIKSDFAETFNLVLTHTIKKEKQ